MSRSNLLISIIILTKDEELNLPHALESVRPLGANIYVVDSGSTDRTVEIARSAGCEVARHEFISHAAQTNWAIETLGITTPWIMRLDADERLTPELVSEITATLPGLPDDVTGLSIKRRVYFWGRWIRHGGYYPTWLTRIWRTGCGRFEDRWMDEHVVLSRGSTQRLQNDFIDENHKGLGFWIGKHNTYADLEVRDILSERVTGSTAQQSLQGQPRQRRWLKSRLYGRSPLFLRAALYWFWRYVVRLGFLDGRPGLVFHFLQGFWYRFLVDAKLVEALRTQEQRH